MLNKIKATKFNSIQELIDTLFASNLVFVIDSETKEDIYILNESKAKNQSEHYGISRDKQGKYYLDEKED
jgi:hypothetical protein